MAIQITIDPPDLQNNEVHTSTIIEVRDENDSIIINQTINLPDDLLNFTSNIELVPHKTYKAKARFIFTPGGLQGWSEYVEFTGDDTVDINLYTNPPVIPKPPIITNSLGINDLPLIGLKFKLTDTTLVNTAIRGVSWILQDNTHTVISDIGDSTNTTDFNIYSLLKPNTLYTLLAAVELSTGGISMLGGYQFSTGLIEDRGFKVDPTKGDYNKLPLNELYLILPTGINNTTVEIIIDNEITNTFTVVGDKVELADVVPADKLVNIRFTANLLDGSTLGPVYYFNIPQIKVGFPYNLPVELGVDERIDNPNVLPNPLPVELGEE